MLIICMLVTANNQHAMEWDPHSYVGYSSSHAGYSYVGYSHIGFSYVGYFPHVGHMAQKYNITNLRSPACWLLLHKAVITKMRAIKLQGTGRLSRMLVISCWLLHLAGLVRRMYVGIVLGSGLGLGLAWPLTNLSYRTFHFFCPMPAMPGAKYTGQNRGMP